MTPLSIKKQIPSVLLIAFAAVVLLLGVQHNVNAMPAMAENLRKFVRDSILEPLWNPEHVQHTENDDESATAAKPVPRMTIVDPKTEHEETPVTTSNTHQNSEEVPFRHHKHHHHHHHHKHHRQHTQFLSHVLDLFHIYNNHESQLQQFIEKHFSHHVELFNSVWETHRYLYGLQQVKNLFIKQWKKDNNALLVINDLAQEGNKVAAKITIDFTDPESKKRIKVEGIALFYFDVEDKFHRIYFAYDHHRVALQKERTKVKNPLVEKIFSLEPSQHEAGHIGHAEPYNTVRDLVMKYNDQWNNRDTKTLSYFHGSVFKSSTKFYASGFGSERHLSDYDRIKTFMISEDYLRGNYSMHLANDLLHDGNQVIMRVTKVLPISHKKNSYFKKDNEVDPESSCKIPGVTCAKVEGIAWFTFDRDGYIDEVFVAQDSYRMLLKSGVLKDVEKDESLDDYEEAQKE